MSEPVKLPPQHHDPPVELPSTTCKWLHYDPAYPQTLWFGVDYVENSVVLMMNPDASVMRVIYTPANDPRRHAITVPVTDLVEWLLRCGAWPSTDNSEPTQ